LNMANHKSTKKRIRSSKTRNEGNKYLHKTVRNAIRNASGKSSETSKDKSIDNNKIVSMIDKLEKRNIIHKNKAARLKSRLMRKSS